jgi:hypothetical protein
MLFYASPVVPEKKFGKAEANTIRERLGLSKLEMFRLQRGGKIALKTGTVIVGVGGMRKYLREKRMRLPVRGELEAILKPPTLRERVTARLKRPIAGRRPK